MNEFKQEITPAGGDAPRGAVWKLLFPSAEFTAKKHEDHRRYSAVVLGILAFFIPLNWGWDWFVDPVGARNTIGLRLAYLVFLPIAYGIWSGKPSRRFLMVTVTLALLLSEALFIIILSRLDHGFEASFAGFMYIMFIVILITQGIPLIFGVAATLGAALLPHIMVALGLVHGFPEVMYAALIWPATVLIILSQVAIALNYSRRYEFEKQLERLSDTDPLSGVGNRRYFMPLLERETIRARRQGLPLSLLMLDIDRFKQINDTHGHPTGDLVIRRLAELCVQVVRQIDVVARVGGEEFTVLLPNTMPEDAAAIAERIRQRAETITVQSVDNEPVRFSVSVGIAELSPDDSSGQDLFVRADVALYAAKDGGRNKVVCG